MTDHEMPPSDEIPPYSPVPAVAPVPPPRPFGLWPTLGWAALAFALWFAAQFVVLVSYTVWFTATHPGQPIKPEELVYDGFLIAMTTVVGTVVLCAVIAFAVRTARADVGDYLALDRPALRGIARGLAYVVILIIASDVLSYLVGREAVPQFVGKTYSASRGSGALHLVLFAVVIAAPVGEEVVFRGFLYRGLAASRLGVTGTIVITAAIWAVLHIEYDWFDMVQIFAIGLLFGWIRWRSSSTSLTIVLHAAVNLIAVIEAALVIELSG
jgi:membrane protease YdiL (CAAX protease family)